VLLWPQVDVKQLEEVLRTHEPLCWDCGVIEGFIQKHPDQVVLRPEHR
jgi:molybdopterin-guanine dinucleotide biosynthesis protein